MILSVCNIYLVKLSLGSQLLKEAIIGSDDDSDDVIPSLMTMKMMILPNLNQWKLLLCVGEEEKPKEVCIKLMTSINNETITAYILKPILVICQLLKKRNTGVND